MLTGTHEDLCGICHPPQLICHPSLQDTEVGRFPHLIQGFLCRLAGGVRGGKIRRDQSHAAPPVRRHPENQNSEILWRILITTEPDRSQNFFREVATWKHLSHPNVLELIGVTIDDHEYSIVSPWMEDGSIIGFLREDFEANPLGLVRTTMYYLVTLLTESCHS